MKCEFYSECLMFKYWIGLIGLKNIFLIVDVSDFFEIDCMFFGIVDGMCYILNNLVNCLIRLCDFIVENKNKIE